MTAQATEAVTAALMADPGASPDQPTAALFSLDPDQRERIALAGLRKRFSELRGKIAVLDRLASEQSIEMIDSVEKAVFLLFPHTVYKSYSLSWLERGQFDKLTRWAQGLTTVDLSGLADVRFEMIDDWIVALNDKAGLQLVHTSGTSGKLSFLPRLRADEEPRLKMMANIFRDWNGEGAGPDVLAAPHPVIYPSYRSGALAGHRTLEVMARKIARDESNVLALYPEYFSADVASLAGRLRTAEQRGEQGRMELPAALIAKRDEFLRRETERAARSERFFAEAQEKFGGQNVVVSTVLPIAYDWAVAGLARGMREVFGPDSILLIGGGTKGRDLPDDAMATVLEFMGIARPVEIYGMSEISGICPLCEHGNHHIPPHLIPFVLDPETGAALPRAGRQTGRFAVMDLFPADHWGGFVSGDRVTMAGWDEACTCGRTGPYVENSVRRFTELEGGDDKITCAGAPAAHDKAIEFLANIAG